MGYRNYIGYIPKREYNKIKSFTREELMVYKGEEPDGYVGAYELTTELHGLGKYCDFEMKGVTKTFFKNKELHKEYNEEGEFFVITKPFLEMVITSYKEQIKSYYSDMIIPFFGNENNQSEFFKSVKTEYTASDDRYKFDFSKITDDEQTALFKVIQHVRSFGIEWRQLTPYDLERGDEITNSWKYEYAIFELVRIYKSFDWKRNVMVYYGY